MLQPRIAITGSRPSFELGRCSILSRTPALQARYSRLLVQHQHSCRSSIARTFVSSSSVLAIPNRPTSTFIPKSPISKPPRKSRYSSYLNELRQKHPNIDPASLIASFLILHELTAILPLIFVFFLFKALGLGLALLGWIVDQETNQEGQERTWLKENVEKWIEEGEMRAQKLGRRYGYFGFEKETEEERKQRRMKEKQDKEMARREYSEVKEKAVVDYRIGGDVANLVASYLVVKAFLPLRIYASLRFAPNLAETVMKRFHRLRAVGAKYLKRDGVKV